MAKKILFATTNKRKVWQANTALESFGIIVEPVDIEVNEIQSADPEKIGIAKARAAYEVAKLPVVVNDQFWSIPALNGFPGGYMKEVNDWFESEDFLTLLENKSDRTGVLTEVLAYFDGEESKVFQENYSGQFVSEPRGAGDYAFERIFMYDGSDQTIAEHMERGTHARDITESAWTPFGEWYINRG